ncbi:LytR C-terminal domain-containing protein [Demequina oxidasica]|uniref:LytR C-terminal domain-containing protein n=1 Tax=Demequina oxidasica TaxID=676199 RepID=UPI00128C01B0|nr:LytR C-terminal domain-containing protein [Demequina oxidasica]
MTQPPMDPTASKRATVRRHRRERQILLFGLILIGMAVAGVFFASVYKGDTEGPFAEPFVTPASDFATEVNVACPPGDALPMEPTEIPIRVLNSTDKAGLAGTTASDLKGRGFVVTGAGNYPRPYEGSVRIIYGEKGLVEAYTISTYFTQSEMVLDTRDSAVSDLVIGDEYDPATTLRPQGAPELDPEVPFVRPQQCVPVELVAPEPAPRVIPDNPLVEASPSASASAEDVPQEGDN